MNGRRIAPRVFRWAVVPGRTGTAHLFHREEDGTEASRCLKWSLTRETHSVLSTVISAHTPFCRHCWEASRPGRKFPGQPAGAASDTEPGA